MISLIKNAKIYAPKELGIKDILVLNSKIYKIEDKLNIFLVEIEINCFV